MGYFHLQGRWFILLLCVTTVSCSIQKTNAAESYGRKIHFTKDVALHFSDFDLTYIGERHVPLKAYPHGFTYYDFVATTGEKTVKVSWTSGTGNIGPYEFKIAGHTYDLELRISDKLGSLQTDELVVNRK